MKYLKKFENENLELSWVESNEFVKPSLTMNDELGELVNYYDDSHFQAKYVINENDIDENGQVCLSQCGDIFTSFVVDGVELSTGVEVDTQELVRSGVIGSINTYDITLTLDNFAHEEGKYYIKPPIFQPHEMLYDNLTIQLLDNSVDINNVNLAWCMGELGKTTIPVGPLTALQCIDSNTKTYRLPINANEYNDNIDVTMVIMYATYEYLMGEVYGLGSYPYHAVPCFVDATTNTPLMTRIQGQSCVYESWAPIYMDKNANWSEFSFSVPISNWEFNDSLHSLLVVGCFNDAYTDEGVVLYEDDLTKIDNLYYINEGGIAKIQALSNSTSFEVYPSEYPIELANGSDNPFTIFTEAVTNGCIDILRNMVALPCEFVQKVHNFGVDKMVMVNATEGELNVKGMIHESQTAIKANGFKGLSLKSVMIPEGITDIKANAFENCEKLNTTWLPSTIESLDDYAFRGSIKRQSCFGVNKVKNEGVGVFDDKYDDTKNEIRAIFRITEAGQHHILTSDNNTLPFDVSQLEKITINDEEVPIANTYNFTAAGNYYINYYFKPLNEVDLSCMFVGCLKLHTISFKYLEISTITNTKYLFAYCTSLEGIDFDNFDTSHVTDMSYMFGVCTALRRADMKNINTSNVTRMDGVFENCNNLTSLDLSSWDTSNVTTMYNMFAHCNNLTSLDLSNFDTHNVTNMDSMFQYCRSLTSLDLSSFNTSNVTTMELMFNDCNGLTSLDLSNFNTSNVTNMDSMFYRCSGLTSLDLTSFNTSNITSMFHMFAYCHSLTSLDLSSFNTSKVTSMASMFNGCSGLTSLDLSNFNTSKVTSMASMFDSCHILTSIDLSSFDTSNVTSMNRMFENCSGLTSIDLSSFNTSNLADMYHMFYGCGGLTSITFGSQADVSKVTSYTDAFKEIATNGTLYYPLAYADAWKNILVTNKNTSSFPSRWTMQGV